MDSYRKAFWGTLLCELETHARTHALVKASFSYSHILCQTYSPVGTWCQTPSRSRHVPAEWKMNLKRVNNAYLDIARKWDTFFQTDREKGQDNNISNEKEHGLCACTVDNPHGGLSLRTGAQTMLFPSLVHMHFSRLLIL